MGFFGKLEHWVGDRWGNGPSMSGLESSIKGTAKLGGKVAPLVSMVNPLLGAGLAAAGGVANGRSLADIVKDAALTGGTGYVLGHAGDLVGRAKGFFGDGAEAAGDIAGAGPGTVSIGGISAPAPVAAALPKSVMPAAESVAGAGAGGGAGGTGMFSAALNYAKHNPKDVAIGAGYAANAMLQNSAQNSSNRINERQIALNEREYDDAQKAKALQQEQLDPVRQILAKWLAQRMGITGAPA